METKIAKIETITQCNRLFSEKTLHPLISLVTLSDTQCHNLLQMGFYSVLLKEHAVECRCFCGWQECDFSDGTLMFLPPWRTLDCNSPDREAKGWLLCFHPDLIRGTWLEGRIGDYTFFGYRHSEALHLSHRELTLMKKCMESVPEELHRGMDEFSIALINNKLGELLNYGARFYKRQFITRREINVEIIKNGEKLLENWFFSGHAHEGRLPDAEWFARMLNLSAAYFDDLLKHETGMGTEEYVELKRLDIAREQLSRTGRSVAEIAGGLGYPSAQYFSCLFKKITGLAPNEYRILN